MNKFKFDKIQIVGILFLVITLITGTAIARNRGFSLNPNSKAVIVGDGAGGSNTSTNAYNTDGSIRTSNNSGTTDLPVLPAGTKAYTDTNCGGNCANIGKTCTKYGKSTFYYCAVPGSAPVVVPDAPPAPPGTVVPPAAAPVPVTQQRTTTSVSPTYYYGPSQIYTPTFIPTASNQRNPSIEPTDTESGYDFQTAKNDYAAPNTAGYDFKNGEISGYYSVIDPKTGNKNYYAIGGTGNNPLNYTQERLQNESDVNNEFNKSNCLQEGGYWDDNLCSYSEQNTAKVIIQEDIKQAILDRQEAERIQNTSGLLSETNGLNKIVSQAGAAQNQQTQQKGLSILDKFNNAISNSSLDGLGSTGLGGGNATLIPPSTRVVDTTNNPGGIYDYTLGNTVAFGSGYATATLLTPGGFSFAVETTLTNPVVQKVLPYFMLGDFADTAIATTQCVASGDAESPACSAAVASLYAPPGAGFADDLQDAIGATSSLFSTTGRLFDFNPIRGLTGDLGALPKSTSDFVDSPGIFDELYMLTKTQTNNTIFNSQSSELDSNTLVRTNSTTQNVADDLATAMDSSHPVNENAIDAAPFQNTSNDLAVTLNQLSNSPHIDIDVPSYEAPPPRTFLEWADDTIIQPIRDRIVDISPNLNRLAETEVAQAPRIEVDLPKADVPEADVPVTKVDSDSIVNPENQPVLLTNNGLATQGQNTNNNIIVNPLKDEWLGETSNILAKSNHGTSETHFFGNASEQIENMYPINRATDNDRIIRDSLFYSDQPDGHMVGDVILCGSYPLCFEKNAVLHSAAAIEGYASEIVSAFPENGGIGHTWLEFSDQYGDWVVDPIHFKDATVIEKSVAYNYYAHNLLDLDLNNIRRAQYVAPNPKYRPQLVNQNINTRQITSDVPVHYETIQMRIAESPQIKKPTKFTANDGRGLNLTVDHESNRVYFSNGEEIGAGEPFVVNGRTYVVTYPQSDTGFNVYERIPELTSDVKVADDIIDQPESNQNPLALGWNRYVVRPANAVAEAGTRAWDDWIAGPVNRMVDNFMANPRPESISLAVIDENNIHYVSKEINLDENPRVKVKIGDTIIIGDKRVTLVEGMGLGSSYDNVTKITAAEIEINLRENNLVFFERDASASLPRKQWQHQGSFSQPATNTSVRQPYVITLESKVPDTSSPSRSSSLTDLRDKIKVLWTERIKGPISNGLLGSNTYFKTGSGFNTPTMIIGGVVAGYILEKTNIDEFVADLLTSDSNINTPLSKLGKSVNDRLRKVIEFIAAPPPIPADRGDKSDEVSSITSDEKSEFEKKLEDFNIFMQTTNDNGEPINPAGETLTVRGCGPSTTINTLRLLGFDPNPQTIIDNYIWGANSSTGADAVLTMLQQYADIDNAYEYGTSGENRILDATELEDYTGILIYGGTANSGKPDEVAHISTINCENGDCYSIDSYFNDGKATKCNIKSPTQLECGNVEYHVGEGGGSPDALFPVKGH